MVLLFVMSDHAWQCLHRNYPGWRVAVTLSVSAGNVIKLRVFFYVTPLGLQLLLFSVAIIIPALRA